MDPDPEILEARILPHPGISIYVEVKITVTSHRCLKMMNFYYLADVRISKVVSAAV